jgi:all-trans-8'-apo-beta-carotenal 15,15'-oxygenase
MNRPTDAVDPATMTRVARSAFSALAQDVPEPTRLEVVEGQLPADLRGVHFRNGPGRHGRGGERYGHPFDGDGYVQRVSFDGEGATFVGRFVRTAAFEAEEAADRILYRGFGTNKPGGLFPNLLRLHFKNAANTHIWPHAGLLLALWEGGVPHRIDPDDLTTLGPWRFDGALRETAFPDRLIRPDRPFAAHPSRCPETGELWSFGTAFGAVNQLLLHRVDRAGRLTTRSLALDGLPFVHDFVLTRRWAVFALPRVRFDIPSALLGLSTPVASLQLKDAPGTALLVPRDGGEPVRIDLPPGFVFHWATGWEEGERVVMDGVEYRRFPDLGGELSDLMAAEGAPDLLARPVRYTLDTASRTMTRAELGPHAVELPRTTGVGAERVVFGTAAPPGRRQPFLSGLVRMDPDGATTFVDRYPDLPGEPVPAGRWLLVPLWRATGESVLDVVDPDSLEVVCRLAQIGRAHV